MLVPVSAYAGVATSVGPMFGLGELWIRARTVPWFDWPSSIWVSTAMAILSGRFAEHMISPTKPLPPAMFSIVGPGATAPSPVCTPIWPVTALKGCCGPFPETNPARRRSSHHRHDSGVPAATTVGQVLLYVPATTPLPLPLTAAVPVVQRVPAFGSSPGMAR